jgi:hypothetical protein
VKRLALVLVLAVLAGRAQEPRVVTHRFTSELELETDRFELTGTEGDVSESQHPPRQVRQQADEVELTDTLQDDEDPPQSFTRLYATVTSSFEIGDRRAPRSKTASAGLEGKTVTFERERDGSYKRSCDDAEVRAGVLKRLRAEVGLAGFLPPKAEGEDRVEDESKGEDGTEPKDAPETWEIPNEILPRLFSPIESEVRLQKARKKEGPKGGLDLAPAALSVPLGSLLLALEGTMKATRVEDGEDEEDGEEDSDELPQHARLEFRLTNTFDGAEALRAGLETKAEDELEITYEGTGTLAWDPDSGRIQITCKGDLRLSETFSIEVEGNGKTAEVKGELVLSGPLSFEGGERRGE